MRDERERERARVCAGVPHKGPSGEGAPLPGKLPHLAMKSHRAWIPPNGGSAGRSSHLARGRGARGSRPPPPPNGRRHFYGYIRTSTPRGRLSTEVEWWGGGGGIPGGDPPVEWGRGAPCVLGPRQLAVGPPSPCTRGPHGEGMRQKRDCGERSYAQVVQEDIDVGRQTIGDDEKAAHRREMYLVGGRRSPGHSP